MKFSKRSGSEFVEGDMTPMIDMTFQLIAFFMVLINFTESENDERVQLASSEIAIPPDVPHEVPITVQLTKDGDVIFNGELVHIDGLKPLLVRERQILNTTAEGAAAATVIVRADKRTKTGKVQELIQVCQETGFEKFALRAKQELPDEG